MCVCTGFGKRNIFLSFSTKEFHNFTAFFYFPFPDCIDFDKPNHINIIESERPDRLIVMV